MAAVPTAAAIQVLGARPVLVDIRDDDFLMDVDQLEAAITPRTKAIVPVHLYGQCVDLDPLMAIARRHGLAVIEIVIGGRRCFGDAGHFRQHGQRLMIGIGQAVAQRKQRHALPLHGGAGPCIRQRASEIVGHAAVALA